MQKLINDIKKLNIKPKVNARIEMLKNNKQIFSELCFCILTANYNAEQAIKIQKQMGKEFMYLPEKKLARRLRELGHRFPNMRARYIAESRNKKIQMNRDWLVANIKGIGMKEASHFLRNTGHLNYAIIDFHIIDVLVKYGIIEKPKTLTKSKYLEIEKELKNIADSLDMTLGELDFYLWYMETGKILK